MPDHLDLQTFYLAVLTHLHALAMEQLFIKVNVINVLGESGLLVGDNGLEYLYMEVRLPWFDIGN